MVDLRPYRKLHAIQLLQGILRRWWRVELAFADATGYVLDHAEGKLAPPNNELCGLALATKDGFKRCNESLRGARDEARAHRKGRRAIVHECHLGFDLIACPIHLGGELQGMIFVGGSLKEPPAHVAAEALLRNVRDLGAPRPGDAAVASIPLLSPGEIDQLCDLLEFGAEEIEAHHAQRIVEERERVTVAQELGEKYKFTNIVGASRPMQQVFRLLEKIIESDSTVLIHGESGTGKELVAKAIHYHGPRASRAFVVQNCSAFNDNLLESALFGHARGSFTGAIKDQKGLFEVADGGTFFLDEVGDMSPSLQVKLLRVLQEGTFTPVGATETRQTDVRVIAASHKDLHKMVERGEFREDLYYRINVIKVTIPPLRERVEDLDLLVEHFLRKHSRGRAAAGGKRPPRPSTEAMAALRRYSWPGNIRELENEIERLLVLGGDVAELPEDLLSARVREATPPDAPSRTVGKLDLSRLDAPGVPLKSALEQLECELIHRGLIRTHWNKSQLAKELGISRSSLIMKAERYGLDKKIE